MSKYYEETMPLEINKDEYLKYYFEESLPLFDKLNTIIKKGQPFQKQALLSKLYLYQSNSLFKSLIQYIINDIETWDKETIKLFPKSLYNLLTQPSSILLSSIDNELFNMILKHIIILITSTDEGISQEYIFYFEKIVYCYSNNNNIHNFPYIINDEIYDSIISLGKFGQTNENRKLSCYLCCAIIRILNKKDENVQKLYSRICFLFCDNEKEVETQLSRELEFLIPIFKNELFENNDILQAIYSYINHDSDHIIQTTTIVSIIKNLYLIYNTELIERVVGKIKEIFEDETNYEQIYKNDLFYELINSLFNNYKLININIIKLLFQQNIIYNFIMKNKKESIIIENFDKIFFIYNDMNNELEILNSKDNNNNNDDYNNINFEELFYSIYFNYFLSNNSFNQRRNSYQYEKENNNKKIFYNNLMKIIPYLINFKNSKCIYEKVNHLFIKENIIFALKCYSENINFNENNNKNKIENNLLYILMNFLLKKNNELFFKTNFCLLSSKCLSPIKREQNNISNNNTNSNINNNENYYIKIFYNILNNIFALFNEYPKLFNNNIHLLLCDFFQRIIRKIYKYLKPTLPNLSNLSTNNIYNNNNSKIKTIDKIYEEIFNSYLIKLVEDQQLGNYVINEIIKVFPYLILYSKERSNYLKFIQDNIIKSSCYFSRRYSIVFLDKCLQIFSFNMFNKIGLLDILLSMINDTNNAISANIINLIYIYSKKIILNSNFIFQNICKNLSKINKLNKDNKSVSIKNFDIEKNRYINKILKLNLKYNCCRKNNDLEEKNENDNINIDNFYYNEKDSWEKKENKLIEIENEIFGNDINYGFNDFKSIIKKQNINGYSQSPEIHITKRKNSYLNNLSNNKELITLKSKEKPTKKLVKDKYSSSVIINHNSNVNSRTFLPKIKHNRNNIISNKNITKSNNIKNINTFKIKQENQKYYEINSKNNIVNNSMININDKSPIKTNYGLLAYTQNDKHNNRRGKMRYSVPSIYPSLYSNINNNENTVDEENPIKSNNRFSLGTKKFKIEITPIGEKFKENQINTTYKTKNNIINLNPNIKSSKTFKIKRDNSLKDTLGKLTNRIFLKISGDNDKFNLSNTSFK